MFLKFIFNKNKKKVKKQFKFDINNWMDLTKEERLLIDSREKDQAMKKKQALLKLIREEYIKIKNKKK